MLFLLRSLSKKTHDSEIISKLIYLNILTLHNIICFPPGPFIPLFLALIKPMRVGTDGVSGVIRHYCHHRRNNCGKLQIYIKTKKYKSSTSTTTTATNIPGLNEVFQQWHQPFSSLVVTAPLAQLALNFLALP